MVFFPITSKWYLGMWGNGLLDWRFQKETASGRRQWHHLNTIGRPSGTVPALRSILKQVRELNLALDKARSNLATIGRGVTAGLGGAVGETQALATAWREVAAASALASRNLTTAGAAGRSAAASAAIGGGGVAKKNPARWGSKGGGLSGLSGVLGGGAEREDTTRFAGTIVGFEI